MKRKHVTLGFLAFCLTATLLVGVTSSVEYDPWYDLNDDGDIDIFDLRKVARLYGTSGTPINKTALLLDLQERVEAKIALLLAEQNQRQNDKFCLGGLTKASIAEDDCRML